VDFRREALGLNLLADAVAERLTRSPARPGIRIQASAGAVRSRSMPPKAVRDEHSAEDGSMELGVELPDVEAAGPGAHSGGSRPRSAGVSRQFALCLRDVVPTIGGRFGPKHAFIISFSYGVESNLVRTILGVAVGPAVRATARISMSA